jgi:RHS repeat-associated protein
VGGVTHTYTVEGTNILREEYGEHVLDYLYGVDGELVGFTYDGTAYYYEKNLQGDVIWLTDASGNEVAKYTYDAWGKVLFVEGNTEIANINPIRYRGYYYDTETQLYYLNSRYYDPETGRFINADDAGIAASQYGLINLYVYSSNTPINNIELMGYASVPFTKNNILNKLLTKMKKYIPNIYSDDIMRAETPVLRIGTKNLYLQFSVGVAIQSKKDALFGGIFKRGTFEISAFLGINELTCFSISAGVTWEKAYIKFGLLLAYPKLNYGVYMGFYVELSIPTWLLAVVSVAVAIASAYSPTIGVHVVKMISSIRKKAKAAAALLTPILPEMFVAIM